MGDNPVEVRILSSALSFRGSACHTQGGSTHLPADLVLPVPVADNMLVTLNDVSSVQLGMALL